MDSETKDDRVGLAKKICSLIESSKNKSIGIKDCTVDDWNTEARGFSVFVTLDFECDSEYKDRAGSVKRCYPKMKNFEMRDVTTAIKRAVKDVEKGSSYQIAVGMNHPKRKYDRTFWGQKGAFDGYDGSDTQLDISFFG